MRIPKVIHKVIITNDGNTPNFNKDILEAINSFRNCNPNYKLYIYNGKYCESYLQKYFTKDIYLAYKKINAYAFKCDLFRYCVLYNEGGIYSDIRSVCLVDFEKEMPSDLKWFTSKDITWYPPENIHHLIKGKKKKIEAMQNTFIMSTKFHPYLKEVIKNCVNNIRNENYGIHPLSITSPIAFYNSIKTVNYKHYPRKYYFGNFDPNKNKIFFQNKALIRWKYKKLDAAYNKDIIGGNNYNKIYHSNKMFDTDLKIPFVEIDDNWPLKNN